MAVDDLDGHAGDDVRPVSFGLDGAHFEIRLGAANAARLRAGLAPFIRAARRRAGAAPTPVRSMDAELTKRIRRWAREHGYRVSDRGRISTLVLDAYERAHPDDFETSRSRNSGGHPKRLSGGSAPWW